MSENHWLDFGFSEAFFDHCVSEKLSWDAILIDEGQDFRSEWLEALEQLLTDQESRLIVFADQNQNLFRPNGIAGLPTDPLQLDINCRNTPQINRRANAAIEIAVDCLRRSDGLEPELRVEPDRSGLLRTLRSELHRLIVDENFNPNDVAILSPSRALVSEIQANRIGRWKTVAALENGLVCETVQRFKGLERDAVLLVLPDDGPYDPMLGYVAMSRARSVLTVISEAAPAAKLNW